MCRSPMWRENLSKVVGLLPCDLEKSLVQIQETSSLLVDKAVYIYLLQTPPSVRATCIGKPFTSCRIDHIKLCQNNSKQRWKIFLCQNIILITILQHRFLYPCRRYEILYPINLRRDKSIKPLFNYSLTLCKLCYFLMEQTIA